jgi:hypothetical protein
MMSETGGADRRNGDSVAPKKRACVRGATKRRGKQPAKQRRRKREKPWKQRFLAALRKTCNVADSARKVRKWRNEVYRERNIDPEFAAAWDEAIDEGVEALELKARQRAMAGSDVLTIFLLKAHRPEKYRDSSKLEVTGQLEHVHFMIVPNGRDPELESLDEPGATGRAGESAVG